MLLRRITQHVRDQNWFAVFIDFLIVVFGLFIGLQVNNWNENRKNIEIANSYIDRIETDLATQIKYFEHTQNYFKKTREHAIAALAAYQRPSEELDVQFLIDLYQASQTLSLTNRSGTYDELLATGRIDLIASTQIRTMLNHYYESGRARIHTFKVNTFVPYRKIARMHLDEAVQLEIRKHCDDVYTISDENYYYLELPDKCDISIPEEIVKREIINTLANDELRQELRYQLTSLDSLINSIKNGIQTTETTLAKLKELE
ncbi:MAG: hypothetical protein HKN88_05675 [Gammaproteobacteria bacterium]|nr:hypothetical protein [Gammaproteobacteria bacterium]NNC97544.1 hypothetical protein [Gammaproteobacteria bacterium]